MTRTHLDVRVIFAIYVSTNEAHKDPECDNTYLQIVRQFFCKGHIWTINLQKVNRDQTLQGQPIIGIQLKVNKMPNECKNKISSHNLAKYPIHVNDVVGEAIQRFAKQ